MPLLCDTTPPMELAEIIPLWNNGQRHYKCSWGKKRWREGGGRAGSSCPVIFIVRGAADEGGEACGVYFLACELAHLQHCWEHQWECQISVRVSARGVMESEITETSAGVGIPFREKHFAGLPHEPSKNCTFSGVSIYPISPAASNALTLITIEWHHAYLSIAACHPLTMCKQMSCVQRKLTQQLNITHTMLTFEHTFTIRRLIHGIFML